MLSVWPALLAFAFATPPPPAVPFQLFDNRLLVEAQVNGQGPFTMIFDTGGSNVLTPSAAARLGAVVQPGPAIKGAGARTAPSGSTKIASIRIVDYELRDQEFLVLDLSSIQRAFGFPKLDGVVGYEFLQKYTVSIDFMRKLMAFVPVGRFQLAHQPTARIPFELVADKPVIDGAVNGVAGKLLIDTGDRSAFTLFARFAATHALTGAFSKSKVDVTGCAVGGPIPARRATLPSLRLGANVELGPVATRLPEMTTGLFASSELAGSVGIEVLRRFDVIFDYQNKEMILTRNPRFKDPYRVAPVPNQCR